MLFAAVTLYFLLACLVSWLALFPSGRARVLHTLATSGLRMGRQCRSAARLPGRWLGTLHACGRGWCAGAAAFLHRRRWLLLSAALLLGLPPVGALLSGRDARLEGFEAPQQEVNDQVAALLAGEYLVPPPALPPLAFAGEELQQARPLIATASRDWTRLDPGFEQRLLHAFRIMKEKHGYEMAILEGYRSPERQNLLAKLGPGVTNAAAWQSWHQYGLAADSAFVRNGKIVISEKDPWAMRGYALYGQVAESLGLTWGGRWKMMDLGHTELPQPGVMRRSSNRQ